MILPKPRISSGITTPVIHLELHTPNLGAACAFYGRLLGWQPQRIAVGDATYQSLDLGPALSGGVVECWTERAVWLPYVEADSVTAATAHAVALGASTLLAPREGPAGWRSVVTTPDGGAIAFWQSKR